MVAVRSATGRAAAALIVAGLALGCQRQECSAPADVSGVWQGDYTSNRNDRRAIQLLFTQSGDAIEGGYSIGSSESGRLYGLRVDRRVEFDITSYQDCAPRVRGVARFCGEQLDLTLDGSDCRGTVHGHATLRRVARAGGGRAGAQAAAGSNGAGREPAAGAGGAEAPFCMRQLDGQCDEPEGTDLCAEGTDPADCAPKERPCVYRKDGQCDEPEGTGACAEGMDPEDCEGVVICGARQCTVPEGANAPMSVAMGQVYACCTAETRCGVALFDDRCFEIVGGAFDQACADAFDSPLETIGIGACCRGDGRCGLTVQDSHLGCVLPESLGIPIGQELKALRCSLGPDDPDAGSP